jgi:hypothetical protein
MKHFIRWEMLTMWYISPDEYNCGANTCHPAKNVEGKALGPDLIFDEDSTLGRGARILVGYDSGAFGLCVDELLWRACS